MSTAPSKLTVPRGSPALSAPSLPPPAQQPEGGPRRGLPASSAASAPAPPTDPSATLAYVADVKARLGALLASRKPPPTSGRAPLPPYGLVGAAEQVHELHTFLQAVATRQENNSLLIAGPHGSGKKAVLRTVIDRLRAGEGGGPKGDAACIVVWLQGSCLSDDVAALRELSRQLSLDMPSLCARNSSARGTDHR